MMFFALQEMDAMPCQWTQENLPYRSQLHSSRRTFPSRHFSLPSNCQLSLICAPCCTLQYTFMRQWLCQ